MDRFERLFGQATTEVFSALPQRFRIESFAVSDGDGTGGDDEAGRTCRQPCPTSGCWSRCGAEWRHTGSHTCGNSHSWL